MDGHSESFYDMQVRLQFKDKHVALTDFDQIVTFAKKDENARLAFSDWIQIQRIEAEILKLSTHTQIDIPAAELKSDYAIACEKRKVLNGLVTESLQTDTAYKTATTHLMNMVTQHMDAANYTWRDNEEVLTQLTAEILPESLNNQTALRTLIDLDTISADPALHSDPSPMLKTALSRIPKDDPTYTNMRRGILDRVRMQQTVLARQLTLKHLAEQEQHLEDSNRNRLRTIEKTFAAQVVNLERNKSLLAGYSDGAVVAEELLNLYSNLATGLVTGIANQNRVPEHTLNAITIALKSDEGK